MTSFPITGRNYAIVSIIALVIMKFIAGWQADDHLLFFACIFVLLKPLGMRTWWDALGAAAMSSALYIIYDLIRHRL